MSKSHRVEVNPDDVRSFANLMIFWGIDADAARTVATIAQTHFRMTEEYVQQFAHGVWRIVQWAVPPRNIH